MATQITLTSSPLRIGDSAPSMPQTDTGGDPRRMQAAAAIRARSATTAASPPLRSTAAGPGIYVDGKALPNTVDNRATRRRLHRRHHARQPRRHAARRAEPATGFMTGKLKVAGDMSVAAHAARAGPERTRRDNARAFVASHRDDGSAELFGIAELCREFGMTLRAALLRRQGPARAARASTARASTRRRDRARLALILRAKASAPRWPRSSTSTVRRPRRGPRPAANFVISAPTRPSPSWKRGPHRRDAGRAAPDQPDLPRASSRRASECKVSRLKEPCHRQLPSAWMDEGTARSKTRRAVSSANAGCRGGGVPRGPLPHATWREAGAQGLLVRAMPEAYGGGGGDFAHDAVILMERPGQPEQLRRRAALGHRRALHPALRQRGAEAALAAEDGHGQADHRDRDDRARHRLRPAGDPDRAQRTATTTCVNGRRPSSPTAATPTWSSSPAAPAARIEGHVAASSSRPGQRKGFRRGRLLDKIGMKAQDTAELFFDDLRVSATTCSAPPARASCS